jgi:signal transduction histidine kinase
VIGWRPEQLAGAAPEEAGPAGVGQSAPRLRARIEALELRLHKREEQRRAMLHIMSDLHEANRRLSSQRRAMLHIMADLHETTAAVQRREQELREAHEAKDQLLARLAFLAAASTRLAGSLEFDATLGTVADLAVPEIADWCAVEIVDGQQTPCSLVVRHVDPTKAELTRELLRRRPLPPDDPHGAPNVIGTGASELLTDVQEWLREADASGSRQGSRQLEILRALQLTSYMSVPLVSRRRTLGALSLGSAGAGRRYGPADLALAEDLAHRAALAIDNARLYVEAQDAIRAREAFVARASHELRTPLTSVLGTIALLKKAVAGALRESPEALIDMASRNLSATLAFINDLLDVSKLAAGQETLSVEPVNVAEAVQRASEVVAAQARDKGVAIRVAVPTDLQLAADRLKLEQVIINLLANAVKFSPAGGEVMVCAESDADGVLMRVRDGGEGIAREDLERIFEPFYQSGRGHARRRRGTGLGLAICRQIVTLHGGRIWAETDGPGRGSTLNVRLPGGPATGKAAQ